MIKELASVINSSKNSTILKPLCSPSHTHSFSAFNNKATKNISKILIKEKPPIDNEYGVA